MHFIVGATTTAANGLYALRWTRPRDRWRTKRQAVFAACSFVIKTASTVSFDVSIKYSFSFKRDTCCLQIESIRCVPFSTGKQRVNECNGLQPVRSMQLEMQRNKVKIYSAFEAASYHSDWIISARDILSLISFRTIDRDGWKARDDK